MSTKSQKEHTKDQMKEQIINHAKSLGFDLVKVTSARLPSRYTKKFQEWIKEGKHAEMKYMAEREKLNEEVLPGAKSVICLAINYFNGDLKDETPNPLQPKTAAKNDEGRVARYAVTRDYHKIFKSKLKKLAHYIETEFHARTRYYNDTGPVLERAYAQEAGLGYTGRNTCVITKEFGSWILLAEIFTDLDLPVDDQAISSGPAKLSCGTCTRCIDLCPTKAIASDYTIDAAKCISYLTIENRGEIPLEYRDKMGNWLFGCDICQDVCPHNAKARPTRVKEFQEIRIKNRRIPLKKILAIKSDGEFLELFAGSPLIRAKRGGLIRNACVVAGNSGDKKYLPPLKALANSKDSLIAGHAKWAIDKINSAM